MSLPGVNRKPSEAPTPLDWASFYIEELKYGVGPKRVERASDDEIVEQLTRLLIDAGVTSMTGRELLEASTYYGLNLAGVFKVVPTVTLSAWMDGLMHGIALAGDLKGPAEHVEPDGV